MADPMLYDYPDPLEGWKDQEPLPTRRASSERNPDGKSLKNTQTHILSQSYTTFIDPLAQDSRGAFDIHIYYTATSTFETSFARSLHERIRREFPELRIYPMFDRPVGPHPKAMFEVNLFSPQQFGAFVPWLVIHRGPLSALLHPNTDDAVRDHTQRATWMGQQLALNVDSLIEFERRRAAAEKSATTTTNDGA